jgi:glycine dehydrogenase subunit 1
MPYIPNTDNDRRKMLDKIGVADFDALLSAIPEKLRLNRPLDIPALPEQELLDEIRNLSRRTREDLACFAGGGVYDHFIPAALESIISRPEFMTAYTPYQAEVAQGTLQVIYEFQTHICRLTGMEVANASMYDGASSAAEALVIAAGVTRKKKVIVSETVNPLYRQVIRTYLSGRDLDLLFVPMKEGLTDLNRIEDAIDENTACVLTAQPNFFGLLEDIDAIPSMVHKVGGKFIMAIDPVAQALLKTPADYNADIVVGEGQPLGIPVSFGGPLVGFFAARKELIRQLPGRIAARTKDVDGKTGFVLTLQTREQHIRREKATSNICTNQALCAAAVSVYLSLMGKAGLKQVALLSAERAQEVARAVTSLAGVELYFDAPFVREFAIKLPQPAERIILGMVDRGILPGIDAGRWFTGLDDCMIIALTEKRSDDEVARLVEGLKELTTSGVLSHM